MNPLINLQKKAGKFPFTRIEEGELFDWEIVWSDMRCFT